MTYRKDLDFLRALAMVGIFLYHLSVSGLSGGYVFLELFFVISGYLISSIIISKIEADKFSIKSFYINRFFRLFPALITAILVTLIAGLLILTPEHFKSLGTSALLGTISLSNVYFWTEVDYFDIGKYLKPLLHTWSLGVEEQFYFIWPAILVAAFAFKNKIRSYYICLITLFFISLAISVYWSYSESMSAGAYYLLPSRMYEFALGALIARFGPMKVFAERINKNVSDVLFISGLMLIAAAVATYKESFAFPSHLALLPCLGAVLCILGGEKSRLADKLSTRFAVYTGQISYSLYLVHWPIIVFYKYTLDRALNVIDMGIIFALAFGLATALHVFVEQPFRQKTGPFRALDGWQLIRRHAGRVSAAGALCVAAFSLHIHSSNGMRYRLNTDMQAALSSAQSDYDKRQELVRAPACHYNDTREHFESYIARFDACNPPQKLAQSKRNILLIGDSHGADIYGAFSQLRPDVNVIQLTKAGCYIEYEYGAGSKNCGEVHRFAASYLQQHADQIDAVIFKIRGHILYTMDGPDFKSLRGFLIDPAQSYLEALSETDVPVIWLGPNVEFSEDYRDTLQQSKSVKEALQTAQSRRRWKELDALDAELFSRFKDSAVTYISSREICGGPCPMLTDDGIPITPDYGHWGVSGAEHMGEYVLKAPPLKAVVGE